jgi:hypothetical protein
MERPAPLTRLSGEFDAFLFSSLGEDRTGLPLSVVSLLARRDLDPWVEAASLANLPAEAAAQKLTAWIRTIADPLLTLPDAVTTAIRLVALLPRLDTKKLPRLAKPEDVTAVATATTPARRQVIATLVLVAIYLILIIGSQFVRSHSAPSTQANTEIAPPAPNTPAANTPRPSAH